MLATSAGGTHTTAEPDSPTRVIWENLPLVALLNGFYEGTATVSQALSHGDFGLGAFAALDGEMVADGGVMYQVKADGKPVRPTAGSRLAYAQMIKFHPDSEFEISADTTQATLANLVSTRVRNANSFYAIRLTGSFASLQTRAPRKQQMPYPPFCEATKTQITFQLDGAEGTMVGFFSPAYVATLSTPGLHLHFISKDGRSGGHVLAFRTQKVKAEIESVDRLQVDFPRDPEFSSASLGQIATCN